MFYVLHAIIYIIQSSKRRIKTGNSNFSKIPSNIINYIN